MTLDVNSDFLPDIEGESEMNDGARHESFVKKSGLSRVCVNVVCFYSNCHWTFSSGATLSFGYMQQGRQVVYIEILSMPLGDPPCRWFEDLNLKANSG